MTPDALIEIAKVAGVPTAILLYMWINRNPAPKSEEDPAKQILAKLEDIETMKETLHRLESIAGILLDRTPRK